MRVRQLGNWMQKLRPTGAIRHRAVARSYLQAPYGAGQDRVGTLALKDYRTASYYSATLLTVRPGLDSRRRFAPVIDRE